MRRYFAVMGLIAFLAVMTPVAYAHLCDNVWGQLDKIILKPDVTSLVVKDQITFKVLMQSNMDRAMATALRLVGESPAFDVTVTPEKGYGPNIDPGVRYEYTVTLKVKPRQRSGQYPLSFRLVGTREGVLREVKALQMGARQERAGEPAAATEPSGPAAAPGAAQPPSAGAPARKCFFIRSFVAAGLPVVDGKLEEPCWQGALQCTGFINQDGRLARRRTQVLLGAGPDGLYLGVGCQSGAGEAASAEDALTVYLALPDHEAEQTTVTVDAKGKVVVKKLRGGEEQEVEESGVKGVIVVSPGAWFAELAVPARLLGQQNLGAESRCLVNFVRSCQSEPAETSSWQGKPKAEGGGASLEPTAFAEFRFLP